MNGNIPLMYYERKIKTRRYNEYLRDIMDPFNISDRCFIDNYRLPKGVVMKLIDELKPYVEEYSNVNKIPLHLEVLATLNFYASGSHQRRVGLDAFAIMSQAKISTSIAKVSEAIRTKLVHKYVVFPKTVAAAKIKKDEFLQKFWVPGIVGLIDGTHIAVANLPKKDEYAYVNRKNFHSINTQVICDYNLRILSLNARYAGSTHDSFIWQCSKIKPIIERINAEDNNTWLFGDSGYALKPFMMVPYRTPSTEAEENYNTLHCKIRSSIERCIGILKSRFRCLKRESGHLHYTHQKSAHIIYSCATLHNFLLENNYPVNDVQYDSDETIPIRNAEEEDGNSGQETRERLKNIISELTLN